MLSPSASSTSGSAARACSVTGVAAVARSGRRVSRTVWPSVGAAQLTVCGSVRVQLVAVTLAAPPTVTVTGPLRTPRSTVPTW